MWQTCQFDDTDLLSKLVPNRLGAAVTKLSAKLFRFGMGETGAQIAAGMPEKNFLGVEVHTPSVDSLLKQIGEQGRCNLRLIQPPLVQLLAPGGYLHCATDWEDHAQQMLALRNSAEGFAP